MIFALAALCGIPLAGAKGMHDIAEGLAPEDAKGPVPENRRRRRPEPGAGGGRRPSPARGRRRRPVH